MLSLKDIQAINFLWDRAAYRTIIRSLPSFEIYLRGNPTLYKDELGEEGELQTIFGEDDLSLDGFLTFLDGDGEVVFINPAEVVLLTYTTEDDPIECRGDIQGGRFDRQMGCTRLARTGR